MHHEEEDEEEEEEEEKEEATSDDEGQPKLRNVFDCPIDTFPPKYCEYSFMFNECKSWLAEHCPDLMLTKYNRTVTELLKVEQQIAAGVEGITLEVAGKTVKKKKKNKIKEVAKRKENCMVTSASLTQRTQAAHVCRGSRGI